MGGGRPAGPGQCEQFRERGVDRLDERVEIGNEIVVRHETPEELSVVAQKRRAQAEVVGKGNDRVGREQLGSEEVHRELRTRHVRHDHVEGEKPRDGTRSEGQKSRGGPLGGSDEDLRGHGLPRVLERRRPARDDAELPRGIRLSDREFQNPSRDAIAERLAVLLAPDADGCEDSEGEFSRVDLSPPQKTPDGAGHDREDDVVHRPAENSAHFLDVLEPGLEPVEAPVRPDGPVQGGFGRPP
ncbi:MAG: hypothetical protein KatS3mg076_2473 [Candidatus Binatia bacterium]|nr:MAG: hypothetical protein KatS3mg076_2473 [Candidatus Binatia bacterium]